MILPGGFEPFLLIYLMVVTFVAAIVRGYSGFGFSALVVMLGGLVLPPVQVVPIVLLMEIVASIHLLPSVWHTIPWPRLGRITLGSAFSIPFGVYALAHVNEDWMRLVISLMVLISCLLILKGLSFAHHDKPSLDVSLGLVSGAMTGSAAIGGLAVATVFLSIQVEMAALRSTVIPLFLATDIYSTLIGTQHGLLNARLLTLTLLLLPVLFIGVAIGKRSFDKTNPTAFRKFLLILLMVLASAGILKSLVNLYA